MISAHHRSLALIARYIRIEAVEGLPQVYIFLARVIEKIKAACEWLLGGLYHERTPLKVSITLPDTVARDSVPVRENVAKFLKHQKERAVSVLAEQIRNSALPSLARQHAVRTLTTLTGRKFRRDEDRIMSADRWLRKHGR